MTDAHAASIPAELNVLALIEHLGLGGAELLLAQFAAAGARAGIRLHVACLGEADNDAGAQRLQAVGIHPVSLGIPGRIGLPALRSVGNHIASIEPDLVHTHLGTADLLGCLAARMLNVPAVSSIHAMDWSDSGETRERARFALMAIGRRHGAGRVIAVSESARAAYLAQGWDRPDRVVTIHNGIDVSPKKGSGVAVRRELGLEPDDFVVGMVSALRTEKGHDVAIRAVQRLRTSLPRLRLIIAGEGAAGQTISRIAEPLGDAVVLTGARSDIMSLFDSLDLCLHPSRADAFPTTLLEAMAASVPVIASAVGGIPEIVDDGRNGVLVPAPPSAAAIADAILHLEKDPARRSDLAQAGRRTYEARFTAGPWVDRTRTVYEAVIVEARSALALRQSAPVVARALRSASEAVASSLLFTARDKPPVALVGRQAASCEEDGDSRHLVEHRSTD